MNRIQIWIVFLTALFLLTNGAFCGALADHDERKEKRLYRRTFDQDDNDHHRDDHKCSKHISLVTYFPTGNNNIHRPSKTKSTPAPILIKFAGIRLHTTDPKTTASKDVSTSAPEHKRL